MGVAVETEINQRGSLHKTKTRSEYDSVKEGLTGRG